MKPLYIKRIVLEAMHKVIFELLNITQDEIISDSRNHEIVHARSVAYYLLRTNTRMSWPEIGRMMGKRNHSTAITSVKRITPLLEDDDFRQQIDEINERFRETYRRIAANEGLEQHARID